MINLLLGDCLEHLKSLPDNSVDCCVTSPPYWNLRDYGTAIWEGGDENCDHVESYNKHNGQRKDRNQEGYKKLYKHICGKCGAKRKDLQIGIEETPEEYVTKMTTVFREVRRVLKDNGVLFLNLGDSYASKRIAPILKPKDLVGIPWRVAFALQADGWYLRQDIIWQKPNPTPECLSPETEVVVKDGDEIKVVNLEYIYSNRERLKDIKIAAPDGFKEIKSVWETRKNPVEIEIGKWGNVICSEEHRWPISHDRRSNAIHIMEFKDVRVFGYRDYMLWKSLEHICEDVIKHIDVFDIVSSNYVKIDNNRIRAPYEFDDKSLSRYINVDYNFGRFIGLYAAEGGIRQGRGHQIKWTYNSNEDYLINETFEFLKNLGLTPRISNHKAYCNVHVSSGALARVLEFFVYEKCTKKSLNLNVIFKCNIDFRRGLWDGYVDGDGYISKENSISASSASACLIRDFRYVASSIGYISSMYHYESFDNRTDKIYDTYIMKLPYKEKRQYKKGTQFKQIKLTKKHCIGNDKIRMLDIEVDGELFLIGNGLISHNSIKDRCTKAHEYIFLLTKSSKYYFDSDAISEPSIYYGKDKRSGMGNIRYEGKRTQGDVKQTGQQSFVTINKTRNRRSVWTIPTQPFKGAHFAVFPEKLITPCILAGCPEGGVVLDPFMGSGTTGVVAVKLNRKFIGIELNKKYYEMSKERINTELTKLEV